MIRPLAAVVPFAEGARGVTGGFQRLGERFFLEIEPFLAGADAAHAGPRMIPAGEHLGTGGRADGTDEETVERHAIAGQGIDVRRGEIGISRHAEIAPALVVSEDEDDIRRRGGLHARRGQQGDRGEEKENGGAGKPGGKACAPTKAEEERHRTRQ